MKALSSYYFLMEESNGQTSASSKEVEMKLRRVEEISPNAYLKRLKNKYLKSVDENLVVREEEQICLGWKELTYTTKIVEKKCCKVVSNEKKYILNDVSGIAKPGRLVVCKLIGVSLLLY